MVFPGVVCLGGAVGVCGECHRVNHFVIKFAPEGIFDQKVLLLWARFESG